MNLLSRLNRRRVVALVIVLVLVTAGAFVVLRGTSDPESGVLQEDQQLIPVRRGNLVDAIKVTGSVSFPDRENMTFGSYGVVEEVLVKEGQRVSAGDPIATLDAETVARLEREVTDARADVRDAQSELDALVDPPALEVAEAEHRVSVAQGTLAEVVEALDRIASPTDLQIAQAEARISTAVLELEMAEEAVAEAVEPTSTMEMAQARIRVTDAEIALGELEGTPDQLELSLAESGVVDAEVALQSVIEARDEYMAGPSQDDLQNAEDAVAITETELANARSDKEVTERDWSTRSMETQATLDSAAEAYAETFQKWLGIPVGPTSIDPDYKTAFAELGIDIDVLFTVPKRFSGLDYNAPHLPPNDPSTAWDETQVYVWLHFSRSDLVATCDSGDRPTYGVCIEEEFRIASEAYRNAIDSVAEVESQASNAIAAAHARITVAEAALRAASDRQSDLKDLPDPLVAEQLKAAVREASETLARAGGDLADLTHPSDLLTINRQHRIGVARATLDDSREKLDELITPSNSSEIVDREVQVALARASLEEARAELDDLTSGTEHPGYEAARLADNVARESLAEESRKLADLSRGPDPIDLALLQSRLDAAWTLLSESERRLDDATLEAPWDGFVSRVEARAGREIEATEVAAVLVETGVVEVDGTVDEVDILRVQVGAIAEIRMDALPDRTIDGTVSFVGAEANSEQGVVSYPVRVRIDLPPELKAPEGLSAVASITISEHRDVLLLPANAIRGSFTQPTVKLMVDDEVVETPVTLGTSDDFWTAISEGVEEGDMVVAGSDVSIPELAGVSEGAEPQP